MYFILVHPPSPTLQALSPPTNTVTTIVAAQSNKKCLPFSYSQLNTKNTLFCIPCRSRLLHSSCGSGTRPRTKYLKAHLEMNGVFDSDGDGGGDGVDEEEMEDGSEFSWRGGGDSDKDYDKDPELADILGTCLDDPDKARSKMEERLRRKRNRILHTKSGSAQPMKVTFNKFDFSNSYIWMEFYNAPLQKDVSLISDTIRAWHIVGRLGGCNSMNMQLSQSPMDKRPTYDAIQGANVTPTTFYNIGDLEVQDNLARIWVDIGTSEPLLLDILINALTQISSDYVGIKQVMFGGSEYENWRENLKTEDLGYSIHKI